MDKTNISAKKIATNTLIVTISNVVLLLVGILAGFIIPKVLGVENYGFFKTFTMYATYTTFLQLGFVNGIYLIYGGKDLDELPKDRFKFYFRLFSILELAISAIFIVAGVIVKDQNISFILVFLGIYSLCSNIMTYFQLLSQITMRFKEYSARIFVQSILKVLVVGIVLALYYIFQQNFVDYKIYTILYISLYVFLAIWYIFTYRDLIFGKFKFEKTFWSDIKRVFITGIPLLVADAIVICIQQVDHQFVNIFFTNAEFSIFSFAYSILALVTVLVGSLSNTFYPVIKRTSKENLSKSFLSMHSIVVSLSLVLLCAYFPIKVIIGDYLQEYIGSLPILTVLFVGAIMSTSINIVIQNFYKTLNKNIDYSIIGLIILGVSIGLNALFYFIFKSTISIALATVVTYIIFYFVSILWLRRYLKVKFIRNTVLMLLGMALFYLIAVFSRQVIFGFLLYGIAAVVLVILFNINDLKGFIAPVIKKIESKVKTIHFSKKAKIYKNDSRSFIKAFPLIFVSLLLVFTSTIAVGNIAYDDRIENIAAVVDDYIVTNNKDYALGQIKSSDRLENYSVFFEDARDVFSAALLEKSSVFFESKIVEGKYKPLDIALEDGSHSFDVMFSPRNYFNSIGIKLDVIGKDKDYLTTYLPVENQRDILVTENIADEVIASNPSLDLAQKDYEGLVAKNLTLGCTAYKPYPYQFRQRIAGVIKSDCVKGISNIFPNGFVLSTFDTSLYYSYDTTIDVLFRPGVVSLTSYISILNGAISKNKTISIKYPGTVENIDGFSPLQDKVSACNFFYDQYAARIIVSSLAFILSAVLYIVLINKVERNFLTSLEQHSLQPILMIVISVAYTLVLLTVLSIEYIGIFGFILSIKPFIGLTLSFAVYLILLIPSIIRMRTLKKRQIVNVVKGEVKI